MKWDVFVSHAFEDKEFARAIAGTLSHWGIKVWFDEFELHVGDSLRRTIDYGLSMSRLGIVVLSPSFFAKEWTQKELDALTARETKDKKIILPIWHNVSAKDIMRYSPMLADRFAIDSSVGVDKTVESLLLAINANIPKSRRIKENGFEQLSVELKKTQRLMKLKEIEFDAVLDQVDEIVNIDPLTALPNRRRIIRYLNDEVARSEHESTPLSILMLDLDSFKQINDSYGHLVGDDILKVVAEKLSTNIEHPNVIGRYDGDLFLIVLPDSAIKIAIEKAEFLCQEIRSALIISGDLQIHITISIGIAQYNIAKDNWYKLLDRADHALIKAKNNGGDQWANIDTTY
jgi:diguanylate cyclase (GGDEF)-like protein